MSSLNVRWYASNTIQPAITHSAMVLSIAASTSERWYPNVRSADAAFSANRMAMRAIRIARASVNMCPRVGYEGQAARQDATHDFGQHVGRNQREGDNQAPPARTPQVVSMVVAAVVVVIMSVVIMPMVVVVVVDVVVVFIMPMVVVAVIVVVMPVRRGHDRRAHGRGRGRHRSHARPRRQIDS